MRPFAMTDDEQLCSRAHTKHQEALFGGRVIFIEERDARCSRKLKRGSEFSYPQLVPYCHFTQEQQARRGI